MLIITIHNDGTGNVETGNYDYTVRVNNTILERGSVKGHKRRQGWQNLVSMVLKESTEINRIAMLSQYADMFKEEME